MAKPILNYKGYMSEDPSDRTKKLCIPQIVDRNQVQTLEEVIARAIDRGLIAGLKSSAAKSIADGVMLQLGETLNGGTGVIFGDYFSVRPYLTGTIENLLSPITAENKLRVRFVPGNAYKLDGKDFSFHNVTQTENVPSITNVQADTAGAPEGSWTVEHTNNIWGKNLQMDAGDKIDVYNCNGDSPVLVLSFPFEEFEMKSIVNNATSVAIPGDLFETSASALGTKVGFKIVRTITVDGVDTTIESNMAVATKYTA